MTGIGVFLFFGSLFLWFVLYIAEGEVDSFGTPSWAVYALIAAFVAGFWLMVAGMAIWLWRVMP